MSTTNLHTFYTETVNNLTLKEALEKHYQVNPQFTPWTEFHTLQGQNLIKSHDISHIIYGCDTSLMGEYKVQMWNNNGSIKTSPRNPFAVLFSKDAKALIQLVLPSDLVKHQINHRQEMKTLSKQIHEQAKSMTKKWEYLQEEQYMDKTVADIREEYGIKILD